MASWPIIQLNPPHSIETKPSLGAGLGSAQTPIDSVSSVRKAIVRLCGKNRPGCDNDCSKLMWNLERVWEDRNKTPVLLASGGIALAIAVADWWTMPYVSLGFFYLFPIMLAAGFLPRWSIALLGLGCAILSELFSSLDRSLIRLSFEALALGGCGLFVAELVLNRKLTLKGRERLNALVETSPAAIMTVDDHGVIELSNQAAIEMMAPRDGKMNR